MPFRELLGSGGNPALMPEALPKLLRAVRLHLGMEVAFIANFAGGRRIFRHVDAEPSAPQFHPGDSDPLEDSYCTRVVDGRLPGLICDARQVPAALELGVTRALPVGAHLSVPLRLSDGTIYGTFCCFSRAPDHSLNERDLGLMRIFADFVGDQIDAERQCRERDAGIVRRLRAVLEGDGLSCAYQPIYDLRRGSVTGYECLSRFDGLPSRGPDAWFAEAASVGLGAELELKAMQTALVALHVLPEPLYLSLNLSPRIPAERLVQALRAWPKPRLILEITEHEVISEYEAVQKALRPLREEGARVAVDDAGAGYASFRHILMLRPDFIKLDSSLTRDIDSDPARRALASALIRFAADTRCEIIAEGVETSTELAALRELGVPKAQGYFLGRPSPLAQVVGSRAAQQA